MRKIAIIVAALSLFTVKTNAQIADVSWGEAVPFSKNQAVAEVVAEKGNTFYAIKMSVKNPQKSTISIEAVSKTSLSSENEFTVYTPTMYGKELEYVGTLQVNDGIIVYFSYLDIPKSTFTAYGQKFSFDGNKIGEFKKLDEFVGNEKTVIGRYSIIRSPFDDGFILCYSRPFILYSDEYFRFRQYDYSLEQAWEREFVFPFKGKEFELKEIQVSTDSSLYMLVRILEDDESAREKKGGLNITYTHSLLSFNAHPSNTDTVFRQIPITVGNKNIADVAYKVTDNREIICAGFYADRKDMAISGAFYNVIESVSGNIRLSTSFKFKKEFIEGFIDKDHIERGVGMRDFELQKLRINDDGSVFMIGEQYFQKITCSGVDNPATMKCDIEHIYNDIVVVKFDQNGKDLFTVNIPKRTSDKNNNYFLTYAQAQGKDRLAFIYNDLPKNVTTTNPLELKRYTEKGGVLVAGSITSSGKASRDILLSGEDAKMIIHPKAYLQTGKNTIIIYGVNGKSAKWGLLSVY